MVGSAVESHEDILPSKFSGEDIKEDLEENEAAPGRGPHWPRSQNFAVTMRAALRHPSLPKC